MFAGYEFQRAAIDLNLHQAAFVAAKKSSAVFTRRAVQYLSTVNRSVVVFFRFRSGFFGGRSGETEQCFQLVDFLIDIERLA